MNLATIIAFVKAVPKLVNMIELLEFTIDKIANEIAEKKFQGYKREIDIQTRRLEGATTNAERRDIIKRLNSIGK